jgi:ABC-2 type transport system ATP-binding protein
MDPLPAGTPVVRAEHLTVKYGSRVALDDVTLSIEEGVVGLLGPNGAGKSTFLKTLLGFCRPAAGSVELLGGPVGADAIDLRRRVGYMPERDVNSPKLSAVSFVSYCGCLAGMGHNDALQRAHEVLNYVGFGEERYRRMETYSMGLRQRAKLAQALVHDPRLLFLDEPTNGLDPVGRIGMLDLILEIARTRRAAILLSSHLLPDIEHVCKRVVLLNEGKVIQEGDIAELTRFRGRLHSVRVKDNPEAFAQALTSRGFDVSTGEDGELLVTQPEGTSQAEIFRAARQGGFQIRQLAPVRQRLEEVFLAAISGDL